MSVVIDHVEQMIESKSGAALSHMHPQSINKAFRLLTITLLAVCALLRIPVGVAAQPPSLTAQKEAFGQNLTEAFNSRDEILMLSLMDINALGLRIARTMLADEKQHAAFARGFSIKGGQTLIRTQFKSLDTSNGRVKFIRITPSGRVLLRFDMDEKGYDYLEFVLERDTSGNFRFVDWFQLSRGELISLTMGALSRIVVDPNPDLLRSLFGRIQMDDKLLEQLKEIGALQRSGRFAEALAIMEKLPEPVANSRAILSSRVMAASMGGLETAYRATLAKLAQHYADDPATAFLLIDHYIYEKQTDKAVQAVETMERRVGIDGVTRMLKANCYLLGGNFAQTVTLAQESIKLEPDTAIGYHSLAAGYLGLKKYSEAISAFTTLSSKFGVVYVREQFTTNEQHADFVKSAAFQKWLPK